MPKSFVGESFTVALISGTEKVWIKEGEVSRFSVIFFCLTVPKVSVGESFTVALISVIEKVGIGEGYHVFPSKSFCLTVPKYFIGEHFGVSEKFFNRKFSCIGGASRFCGNFLSHRTETKSFVREPFCFAESFGYRKSLCPRGEDRGFQ